MSNVNFGIDLLLESQKLNITCKSDVLMILLHWMMCKNGFRCVGIGHDVSYAFERHEYVISYDCYPVSRCLNLTENI